MLIAIKQTSYLELQWHKALGTREGGHLDCTYSIRLGPLTNFSHFISEVTLGISGRVTAQALVVETLPSTAATRTPQVFQVSYVGPILNFSSHQILFLLELESLPSKVMMMYVKPP